MIKRILAAATAALFGALVLAAPAAATPAPSASAAALCSGWYVNPDEGDRKPTQLDDGMRFEPADLIHRAADLSVADLQPGTYVATPAPDQPSFFSVEVRNPSGAYGTLRWNPTTSKWSITIGAGTGPDGAATAGTFDNASPVALLAGKVTKWGAFAPATDTVVSFGVGYTKTPPGTVTTVVKSITFGGKAYALSCKPAPSASASGSASAAPSGSSSATPPPVVVDAQLPVTGVSAPLVAGAGGLLLLVGVAAVVVSRRRLRFRA